MSSNVGFFWFLTVVLEKPQSYSLRVAVQNHVGFSLRRLMAEPALSLSHCQNFTHQLILVSESRWGGGFFLYMCVWSVDPFPPTLSVTSCFLFGWTERSATCLCATKNGAPLPSLLCPDASSSPLSSSSPSL